MLEKIYEILLSEAKSAYEKGEVPISAVIVQDNHIIAQAHNLKEQKQSVIAHAEILAIEEASKYLDNWRLENCDIYVSLEPCSMCASAIHQARINNIYYFVPQSNCGNFNLLEKIVVEKNCNKETEIHYIDYPRDDLKILLQEFFKNRR